MLILFVAFSLCCIALALRLALRHEIRLALEAGPAVPFALLGSQHWTVATLTATGLCVLGAAIGIAFGAMWAGCCALLSALALCFLMWFFGHRGKALFQARELEDMAWIVRQRGTVQDQIMRACEREAMERRLRRCQATLMLTRRGGDDLSQLFGKLEAQVAGMEHNALDAADVVGGFAAHLRHVFMESDRDDIPIGEACQHIARWAQVLQELGASAISISGVPDPHSPNSQRRIPALLMLGATERLGVAALQEPGAMPMHWHWSIEQHRVRLEATGGAPLQLEGQALRDWDAAFMLRHGGIAHAGGTWSFELPLLPSAESAFQKPDQTVE